MAPSSVKGILGKKLGMTQVFVGGGKMLPVTVIEAGPCPVVQVKTKEKDGYAAVQLGFSVTKEQRLSKAERGHLAKAKATPVRHLREVGVDDVAAVVAGETVTVEIFAPGDMVKIMASSKGKGFAGVIKRHKFSGGGESHGSMFHRAPGSIGASAYPSRVIKGKKLPGHMGSERVTTGNLEVVRIMPRENLLLVKGAVPGPFGGLVLVSLSKPSKSREA
jgi:large subunit ribosomal protein L3